MKSIPNIITIFRILLSLILLLLKPLSHSFLGVYLACGLSDIVDGYIARRFNYTSRLGSILDSIADVVLFGIMALVFWPVLSVPEGILLYLAIIALIRITSLLIAFFKYRTFAVLHTYANKATGLLIFCFPFLYVLIDISILGYLIGTVAIIASIEELVIHLISKKLERNIKGLFFG